MIVFPNCKINLGLRVIGKRPDNYHTIETVLYPIEWCDVLEIIENSDKKEPFIISNSGVNIEGEMSDNLIYKAWKMVSAQRKIPAIKVHLHKNIPMGAGLGGGSSDAAHFISLLNDQFNLGFTMDEMAGFAEKLGSDCAFFFKKKPVFARGTGNEFSETTVNLEAYYVLLVYPDIHSSTKAAYEGLTAEKPTRDLGEILRSHELRDWKNNLVNDFETTIFKKHPEIKSLKEKLYQTGAVYASMSGSGSSVYGIYEKEPIIALPPAYNYFLQKPGV